MAYKVSVPVRVRRVEEIDWTFVVNSKEEAEELVDYIKNQGLIALDPDYEEVIEICEEDVLDIYEDDVQIEHVKE